MNTIRLKSNSLINHSVILRINLRYSFLGSLIKIKHMDELNLIVLRKDNNNCVALVNAAMYLIFNWET